MMTFRATIFVVLVAGAMLSAGCGRKSFSTAKPETFIFARGSDAQKLDPADIDDGPSVDTISQICQGLVRFKSGTLTIEPCLADSYSIASDGLTYRFHLRANVRFQDGTPLNAQTALFTFRRQMDPKNPGHLPGANFEYWHTLYQDVDSVDADGPMTVVFHLRKPNASLLRSLAIFPAFLVSPTALKTYGAGGFQRHPVGTGPYKFVSWTPNQAIVMEKNTDYWDKTHPPRFDRLVLKVVPENSVRLLELKSGRVDGINGLQPAELGSLEKDARFTVYKQTGLNVGYLTFNLQNPKFQDPAVREAIAMAIDRQQLVKVALDGAGEAANYPIPPSFLGYPKTADPIPFNPAKARQILATHPAVTATSIELLVPTAPRPYFPDPVKAASFIRAELEKVGLKVTIVTEDLKSDLDDLRNFNYQMALIGWVGDNGDPDNFLSVFFGSWAAKKGLATNFSDYRNSEMDQLLLKAREETDPAKRADLYHQVLALWRRDLPIIPLDHGDNIAVVRREVTGFQIQKTGDLSLGSIGWNASVGAGK